MSEGDGGMFVMFREYKAHVREILGIHRPLIWSSRWAFRYILAQLICIYLGRKKRNQFFHRHQNAVPN